ncbi:extracellular solute-binding protein [Paracoccus pacificus]|uniref:Extracellular solute-binding protein n=1 Tax=Paracoccus pacificus TaxID=1463598 RepID=A0ABW4RCG8_9RHOB
MRIFKIRNESAIAAGFALALGVAAMPLASPAEPAHGIAMYGEPALKDGFTELPYVNPDAPKGGTIRMAESGGFDSLNPWILRGNAPWSVGVHVPETLMYRSLDEPFTLYGLLAESVDTDPARTWVEFTLRPEARFSDGSPVTVEDVIWSYETLGTKGHPRYLTAWSKVQKIEQTGPRSLRISFKEPDRELALLMGMRPVLKKAQWEGKDFTRSSLEVPIGSGAYVIDTFEPGRFITYRRNPDYWGNALAINRGRYNLDQIRYEFFADGNAMFEAFRAGETNMWRELNAIKWTNAYDFPAVRDGSIVKSEIGNQRPSGIIGLVMNTRNPLFKDWRVRQAMIESFNFEFINKVLTGGIEPRITSYFANSALAMRPGPAEGKVLDLLKPYSAELLPGTIEGYALPVSAGTELDRPSLRRAMKLMEDAGWTVKNGVMQNAEGVPFRFEIILNQSGSAMRSRAEQQQIADIFLTSLAKLGVQAVITPLDSAQYVARTNEYRFDMTWYERALSLSPGNELMLYWGHDGVTQPGSRNWMGMDSPPAEAMIDTMLNADSPENFTAAVRALDRILMAGRYVIPVSYSPVGRLAHSASLKYPETIPAYGDWPGFMPDLWWSEAD